MKLLGIDLETGADFKTPLEENFITEIGLVLWDTDFNMPVVIKNYLIKSDRKVSKDCEIYTGITTELLDKHGVGMEWFFTDSSRLFRECDYIVAQNGLNFDKPILEKAIEGKSHEYAYKANKKIWIDTKIDIPYPSNCIQKNLTYLACFHGFCNPFPHRAFSDVLTMFKVMMNYDLDKIIESANSPFVKATWSMPWPNKRSSSYIEDMKLFNRAKDEVKKAGFHYDGEAKTWELTTRKCLVPEFDFSINIEEV